MNFCCWWSDPHREQHHLSPSTLATIERFRAKYPTAQLVHTTRFQHMACKRRMKNHRIRIYPSYDFSRQTYCECRRRFPRSWLSSTIEFTQQYARTREVRRQEDMSRHYHSSQCFRSRVQRDYRTPISLRRRVRCDCAYI